MFRFVYGFGDYSEGYSVGMQVQNQLYKLFIFRPFFRQFYSPLFILFSDPCIDVGVIFFSGPIVLRSFFVCCSQSLIIDIFRYYIEFIRIFDEKSPFIYYIS